MEVLQWFNQYSEIKRKKNRHCFWRKNAIMISSSQELRKLSYTHCFAASIRISDRVRSLKIFHTHWIFWLVFAPFKAASYVEDQLSKGALTPLTPQWVRFSIIVILLNYTDYKFTIGHWKSARIAKWILAILTIIPC